jgi:hypothetical protein
LEDLIYEKILDEIISPENMGINKLDSLEKDCLKEVKI